MLLTVVILGLVIALVGLMLRFALTSRNATAMRVISTVGASMRQNLPLAEALHAAAAGRTDAASMILRRIADVLADGGSLATAISEGYPNCPGHALAMIAAAESIGQLPMAIEVVETDLAGKERRNNRAQPIHPLYPVFLLLAVIIVITDVAVFILPSFYKMFADMHHELPPATRALSIGAALYEQVLSVPVGILVLVGTAMGIYVKFRPRRPHQRRVLSEVGDFVKWHLPILRGLERSYSLLRTVEMLRLSLNAGCTVNDAIGRTLDMDVNGCFRARLLKWRRSVERGEDVAAAARRYRLGSALAWAFDQKVNPGNTLATLESLESSYRSCYSYRANLARFVLWPCVTIAFALIIGFVVYAIFAAYHEILHYGATVGIR